MADEKKATPSINWADVDFDALSVDALKKIEKSGNSLNFDDLDEKDLKVIAHGPDKGFGATASGSMRNPIDVNWGAAIKSVLTEGLHPESKEMSVANNPLLALGPPAAMGGVLGPMVSGPGVASPLQKAVQAYKNIPEPVKDIATGVGGAIYDKATGGNNATLHGVGAALARRTFKRITK